MRFSASLVYAFLFAMLAGCAAGPKTFEPVPIHLVLSADSDINPDVRGRPAPVVVRVYELRNASAFESADFFSLFEKEQAVLGTDLIQREEVVMRPSDMRQMTRRAHPEARVIGVLVAYRNLERGTWRTTINLPGPTEVSSLPIVGPYVTLSPREQQILVQLKYQSVYTSQGKGSRFR